MKKSQIRMFEELLKDEKFRGKKQLRHLLWLNTAEQKAKVGQCFIVTKPGQRVYGHTVKDFRAKVAEVTAFITSEEWYYTLEMEVECGGNHHTTTVHFSESELMRFKRAKTNKNVLPAPKSEHSDEIDV